MLKINDTTHNSKNRDMIQPEPILATKLLVPYPRTDLVPRPHLIERLDQGMNCTLTVISASAGFGKTTLLSEWCAILQERNTRLAWLSLDADDNDPTRFLVYLIRSLGTLEDDVAEGALSLLVSPSPPTIETVITALINRLAEMDDDFVFILDDYHTVTSNPIHRAMAFLLDHVPRQMHLVIAGRTEPPLPLARLRGNGQLIEFGAADLRFSRKEAAVFLRQIVSPDLTDQEIDVLASKVEGWVAGLQMAALTMRGQKDASHYIENFAGDDRNIQDYFLEEVLLKQTEEVQTFLLETSILDRVTGSLCNAVTGRNDGQIMLDKLERANLFIGHLDTTRKWYRYHRLFLDHLRQRLWHIDAEKIQGLHLRASKWYAENNLLDEALGHAMASKDYKWLIELLSMAGWPMLMHGEVNILLACLEALPEETVRSQPRLSLLHAWALLRSIRFDDVERRLNDAEKGLDQEEMNEEEQQDSSLEVRNMLGAVAALRASLASNLGDVSRTIAFSQKALEYISDENSEFNEITSVLRGIVARNLGEAYAGKDDLNAAIRAHTEAIALSQPAGDLFETVIAESRLGTLYELKGHLHQAAKTYYQALETAEKQESEPIPISALAHLGLAEILREWNRLSEARDHIERAIETNWNWKQTILLPEAYANLARVMYAQGDIDEAFETLAQAKQVAQEQRFLRISGYISTVEARIWLGTGNLERTMGWARELGMSADDDLSHVPFHILRSRYITLARLHIARDELDIAAALLDRLLTAAEDAGRMGGLIEILVCQAMVLQTKSDIPQAVAKLKRALILAEPEGYIRTFSQEGVAMARLLGRVMKEQGARTPYTSYEVLSRYVGRLMSALEPDIETSSEKTGAAQPLLEPLSDRELEVLQLLANGLSNREIADKLYVAVNTIKTHIRNIYGKLYVRSRTQAVARANDLNLLE